MPHIEVVKVSDAPVKAALERATVGLSRCLERAAMDPRNSNPGRYCCGKCTVGFWRHLLVGGLDRQAERLRKGVESLRAMRDGKGQWRTFPFWYTVLALSEIDSRHAAKELEYASAALERAAARTPAPTMHAARRRAVAERALERI